MCFVVLPSFCLMAAKALKPCVGLLSPSPPCCRCCQDAQFDHTEVFIRTMIQVPPLVSAKLPYCYSNVIGAAFSAPVFLCHPGAPLLVVCCLAGLFGFALGWSSFAVLRCFGIGVPSSACATLPCPGMSFVWVLYMGGCIYPRGAVGSRPMPWTRLSCSEPHWCIPVVLPVGQPGAPASSIRLPTWFVSWWTECGDSAACLFCG